MTDLIHEATKPVVIVLSQDKHLRVLSDALWASGIDSVTVSHWHDARETLQRSARCIALVDGDLPDVELAQVRMELPGSHVQAVLWLTRPERGSARNPLFAGDGMQFETASKPVSVEEVVYRLKAMLVHLGAPPSVHTDWVGFPQLHPEGSTGQLIAVFSTKGGVGKSLVAVNAAVGLATFYKHKVLLADADLSYGDVATLLDVSAQYSIADVCNKQMHHPTSLAAAVTVHASGVSVLPRPPVVERVDLLKTDVLLDALATYRKLFDYVIVNMSTPLDEFNLTLLDLADRIVMVTTPEIPAIQNTGRFIEIADRLNLGEKLSLVLNRADSGVDKELLETRLALRIDATIRSAGKLVVRAANEGTSLFAKDPHVRQDITRDLLSVVEHLAGRSVPRRSMLRRVSTMLRRAA